ncbi:ABC transporter substrate-binding protein [Phototrophicus methaneseepsis]|uniref:ABC transporter substrate-binding protein n=1 Tax=Phototrophicus methaneseepsis TaxID=2710758 RepID=A0A7S8IFT6_9CHLR|nr:ABC transporter substrate-binding protein [Phototrophicus methaneseepsis]QPC83278.1 ABC transporter substrate-binding protein [Phototrophicus methaneseepsis]
MIKKESWFGRMGLFFSIAYCLLLMLPTAAQETPICADGMRLFTHDLLWDETPDGVCIPQNPQRIAYSWIFHVPALIRGDFPFVGIGRQEYVINEFPEWEPVIETIPSIELPPNLELTLELEPDLIIEPSWAAEENYDELSAIAPTVVFQFDRTDDWKRLAEMYFDAAGLAESYDALIDEYEDRAQELGELIGNPEEIEVSLIWVNELLNLDTDYSVGGMVLADVGFARPETQILQQTPEEIIEAGGYPFYTEISWEETPRADGDFIIAYGDFVTEDGLSRLDDLKANPLWQSLSAVQAGDVYYTSVNWAGGDIAGAHNLLDDIAEAFGVADEFSPNPYKTVPEDLLETAD